MKLVRFERDGEIHFGAIENDHIVPLQGAFPSFEPAPDGERVPLANLRLRAPVRPGKIVAVGPNYKAHLKGAAAPVRPYLWIKPTTSLNDPGSPIVLPAATEYRDLVNFEAEIAIVIGRRAKNITPAQAPDHIFGYTCINDVTAGDMSDHAAFKSSLLFVDGKVLDGFAPLGPHIETELDPSDLRLRCTVNGVLHQDHRTSDMIWPCHDLVALISEMMTLGPGDVIATGSPPGVRPMQPGDEVEVEVEGIGRLFNPVVAAG